MNPSIKSLWTNPHAFASNLLLTYIDAFGSEGVEWEVPCMELEVKQEFHVEPAPSNLEKLYAAVSIRVTDAFFTSVVDFTNICSTLNDHPAAIAIPGASECAWGITEALMIYPNQKDEEKPFSDEICAYVGKVLDDEGILNAPDVLRIASRKDPRAQVHHDYSDDPELFESIYQFEQSKTENITRFVQDRLRQLLIETSQLVLRNGQADKIAHNLLSRLTSKR